METQEFYTAIFLTLSYSNLVIAALKKDELHKFKKRKQSSD